MEYRRRSTAGDWRPTESIPQIPSASVDFEMCAQCLSTPVAGRPEGTSFVIDL